MAAPFLLYQSASRVPEALLILSTVGALMFVGIAPRMIAWKGAWAGNLEG
jgi:hypothetical protein